jgi:hypothetical protein
MSLHDIAAALQRVRADSRSGARSIPGMLDA